MTIDDLKKLFPSASEKTWHQHSNGGGWVQNTAHVDESAHVGDNALVFGKARVSGDRSITIPQSAGTDWRPAQ